MAWNPFKGLFGSKDGAGVAPAPDAGAEVQQSKADDAEIPWVEAAANPWGVRVLDVRPFTLKTLSFTKDRQIAGNAVSYGRDDGSGFIGQEPAAARAIDDASLRFKIDRTLVDGVLFTPREMEHKWALFYHREHVICVRSWLRKVQVVARVEQRAGEAVVTQIRGTFFEEHEDAAFTVRTLDYLLRSHVLDESYPVPLPLGTESKPPRSAAVWCMSMFGNLAWFATPYEIARTMPEKPLRTHSLLHIAVAQGDVAAIDKQLAAGTPIDLLALDGLAPLHWALAVTGTAIMALLLERGSDVDVRSEQGATPLMTAVQGRGVDKVAFLLDRGADPNARDLRGFSSLHRAAEMGNVEVARLLLDRGAAPDLEAAGHTARSLAEGGGHTEIVALLDRHSRG